MCRSDFQILFWTIFNICIFRLRIHLSVSQIWFLLVKYSIKSLTLCKSYNSRKRLREQSIRHLCIACVTGCRYNCMEEGIFMMELSVGRRKRREEIYINTFNSVKFCIFHVYDLVCVRFINGATNSWKHKQWTLNLEDMENCFDKRFSLSSNAISRLCRSFPTELTQCS